MRMPEFGSMETESWFKIASSYSKWLEEQMRVEGRLAAAVKERG